MKNKGFTLVELLAVFVVLALIMMIVLPSIKNLKNLNDDKQYKTYQDMMIEYTKSISNYKYKSHVCLNELKMPKINENINCNGYVNNSNNKLKSFLRCIQDGKEIYKSEGYNLPRDCEV